MTPTELLAHQIPTGDLLARAERELASWVIVADLLADHPDLGVVETHPGHPGEYDCLSVYSRERLDRPPLLDLNRNGAAHLAPLSGGADTWVEVWDACAEYGPVEVARQLGERLGLGEPVVHSGTEAETVGQLARRLVKLREARIDGFWECRNGIEDSSAGPRRRLEWFEQVPAGIERLESAPEGVFGDAAYGFWFLLRDGVPVSCLDIHR